MTRERYEVEAEAARVFEALREASGISREAYFRAVCHGKPPKG